jgi:peroxiredoxin Q/BCP
MDEPVGLTVGEQAPDAAATLVRPGGETERVALSALVRERPVLLSFYPIDFSPDCIREWCAFRDFEWFASGENISVVGSSRSGPRAHRQFIDRLGLGFPLYADTDLGFADAFGVKYRAFGVSTCARRSCFLVDEDREVRYRWVAENWLDPTRDVPSMAELSTGIREALDIEAPDRFGMA